MGMEIEDTVLSWGVEFEIMVDRLIKKGREEEEKCPTK